MLASVIDIDEKVVVTRISTTLMHFYYHRNLWIKFPLKHTFPVLVFEEDALKLYYLIILCGLIFMCAFFSIS